MSEDNRLCHSELESRWTGLRRILDAEGAAACRSAIDSEANDVYRNQLFRFAVGRLGGGTGATALELDAMVTIGDASIAHALDTAARKADDAAVWRDHANATAYNLAANLCDCWGEHELRLQRHFEAGLRYADRALELRRQLNKGPGLLSMAYWARGKHLLSLRRPDEAADAFRASLDCEQAVVRDSGGNPAAVEGAPGSLLNTRAFLGLALLRSGQPEGAAMLEETLAVLRSQAANGEGELKEDAQIYLDQILLSAGR